MYTALLIPSGRGRIKGGRGAHGAVYCSGAAPAAGMNRSRPPSQPRSQLAWRRCGPLMLGARGAAALRRRKKRSTLWRRSVARSAALRRRALHLARLLHARRSREIPAYAADGAWASLPPEIAVEIFGLLDTATLLSCREVCRTWAALCTHAPVLQLDLPGGCCDPQLTVLLATFPRARVLRMPAELPLWPMHMWRRLGSLLSSGGLGLDLSQVHRWEDLETAAALAQKAGQMQLALQLLDRAVYLSPQDVQLHLTRAVVEQRLGLHPLAEADLRDATRLDPSDPETWNELGCVLGELEQHEEALVAYGRALQLVPDDFLYFHNRSTCHMNIGPAHYDQALADANSAVSLAGGDAEVHNHRGNVLVALGRFEDALLDYSAAISIRPQEPTYWRNRADTYYDVERDAEAAADYRHLIEMSPNDTDAWNGLGNAQFALKDYEGALNSYAQAVNLSKQDMDRTAVTTGARPTRVRKNTSADEETDDEDPLALARQALGVNYCNRADALMELGRMEAAMADFDAYVALDPQNPDAYVRRADGLLAARKPEEALKELGRALTLEPGAARWWNARGNALTRLARWEDALADLTRACELDPESSNMRADRGAVLERLDRLEEALADYSKALELAPHDANATYCMCRVLLARGEAARARTILEEAQNHIPQSHGYMVLLAEARKRTGVPAEEIRPLLERVASAAADRRPPLEARNSLAVGIALRELGRPADALPFMNAAISRMHHMAEYYNERALCLHQLGRVAEACDDLRSSLRLRPHQPAVRTRLASWSAS